MTARAKKDTTPDSAQSARFIEAARELGCDESTEAFEAALKKVAKVKVRRARPASDEVPTKASRNPS